MHESPGSNPPSESSDVARDRADDIEQLRERLAFYESFDQLIQDNITRAGALLREAAARKSEGELALRSSAAEFEQKQLAERVNYRRIFSSLLDEVTTVQQNVERLARQVADALDDLEAIIPAAGEPGGIDGEQFPSMPSFSAGSAGELAPGQSTAADQPELTGEPTASFPSDQEPGVDREIRDASSAQTGELRQSEPSLEPVDELVTPDEAQYDPSPASGAGTSGPGFGAAATFTEVVQASVERVSQTMSAPEIGTETAHDIAESTGQVSDSPVESAEPLGDEGLSVDIESERDEPVTEAQPSGYQTEPAESQNQWIDEASRASTTLLVHGVPRATTALSLKRYLEGLSQVHSVEPREYAEGVLRLQVSSDRPVGLDELRGWPDVTTLEPVSVSDEFVEVRLG